MTQYKRKGGGALIPILFLLGTVGVGLAMLPRQDARGWQRWKRARAANDTHVGHSRHERNARLRAMNLDEARLPETVIRFRGWIAPSVNC
jgi:hypothetical protein